MPTVNELLFDELTAHAVDLQQYSEGVIRRMISLLNKTDADLAAELAAALERMPADSFTAERLEALLGSVRQLNAAAYAAVTEALQSELRAFAAYESGYQVDLYQSAIPAAVQVRYSIASVSPNQVYSAAMSRPFQGRLLKDWASNIEAERMTKIRDAIRIGYVEGKTASEIVRGIRGTRAAGYADGLLQRPRRDLMAVVQTAIGHTASVARDHFIEANRDLIKAEVWRSTLDTKTSAPCRLRDGLKYDAQTHKPIGHKVQWLQGPGRLHWNAIPAGSIIRTKRGMVPVEDVRVGDLVLTHTGAFKPVIDKLSKLNKGGVIRAAYMQSGRILRATDDHPVLVAGVGWRFMGALEVGDELFCDPEQPPEVAFVGGLVVPDAENGPSLGDERSVALARTLKLVSAIVDLKGNAYVGPGEIEDKAVEMVLSNPAIIEGKCALHHLLALAEMLGKLGCKRLGQLLCRLSWQGDPAESLGLPGAESGSLFSRHDLGHDLRAFGGVCGAHALGVGGIHCAAVLGSAEGPVLIAAGGDSASGFKVGANLLDFGSDWISDDLGIPGQRSVGESMLSLDGAKGQTLLDVLNQNELAVVGKRFGHDRILALELSNHDSIVYDLGVEGDASYICNGIVVSNCRSTSTPVTKSWRELGIPIDEISPSDRASMDGQVPAETTFASWLQRQSAARQDQVLGPERARLIREGGLKLPDLYAPNGRYLTLDELRERDAAAFARIAA